MADGLAKKGVQRKTPTKKEEIVGEKDTPGGSDVLKTLLKYRKGINTNQLLIQDPRRQAGKEAPTLEWVRHMI